MPLSIDWLREPDVSTLQAYIDRHWRSGHVLATDDRLLRWQYRHPDGDDMLSVLAAHDDDELVGFLGLVLDDWSVEGERRPGAWLAMWHVLPEARSRQGGLALLLEAMRLPVAGIGCLGMNDTAVAIYERLGFAVIPRIPRWIRPIRPAALAPVYAPAAAAQVPAPSSVDARPGDASGERLDAWERTWATALAPRITGTWRGRSYLVRRYLEHPRFHYTVSISADDDALLVYRVEEVPATSTTIIRVVECLGPAEHLAAAMLEANADAAFADFYCTDSNAAVPLERVGFVPESSLGVRLPERFHPLEPPGRGINAALRVHTGTASAYVTKSDGDQDRPA